jgi:hypothetical protein
VRAQVPTGQKVQAFVFGNSSVGVGNQFLPMSPQGTFSGVDVYVASQAVRLYAEGPSGVGFSVVRSSGTGSSFAEVSTPRARTLGRPLKQRTVSTDLRFLRHLDRSKRKKLGRISVAHRLLWLVAQAFRRVSHASSYVSSFAMYRVCHGLNAHGRMIFWPSYFSGLLR